MNNLIGDSQHGLRNKRSCLTILPDFYAQVIDTYDTDNNKAVDLVYLDYQKAFDKIKIKVKSSRPGASQWRIYYHRMWGQ